jgi:hypothetical protein
MRNVSLPAGFTAAGAQIRGNLRWKIHRDLVCCLDRHDCDCCDPLSWAVGFWSGLVHLEVAAANRFAIEGGDGFGSFVIIVHFYESETARSAGLAIRSNVNASDLAERLEQTG